MRKCLVGAIFASFVSVSVSAATEKSPWEDVKAPVGKYSRVIGGNNAGCLLAGEALEDNGKGFQIANPERLNTHYAHPDTLQFIRDLGASLWSRGIPILLGDLSLPRGGPFTTRHASHTNGTDFDAWFLIDSRLTERPLTVAEREALTPYSLASLDGNVLITERWTDKYRIMLQITAENPRTHTVFVHPAIKKKLCENPSHHKPWLAKIRPWWGHDEHMHVRLTCPSDSPDCVEKPRPQSISCDETLEWWFSDEWRKEYEDRKKSFDSSFEMPELHKKCAEILRMK
jgi:penicillin-insensitive murein endopeptidase